MKRIHRGIVLLILLLFTATLIMGCTQSQKGSQELTKVRLSEVVHSIFYAPQYVAINEGFFAEEGLEIDLTTAQGADKVMTALLSGSADIGLAGPEATIYVYKQGQTDYVVNFAQATKTDGSFLVGRGPEPDFKWENLNGKTIIGGRPGGVPQMVLEYVLREHGLTPYEDVNIITNLQFTATSGAFVGGTGDYVANFEPTASMLEQEGVGHVVASLAVASGELPYTVFMAQKSYMEKNPEIIQKVTNAVYKAQLWIQNHNSRDVALSIHAFFPEVDIELLTKVVERYKEQGSWAVNPVIDNDSFNRLQKIIIEAGELDKAVDPNLLITKDFAVKAMDNIEK